MPVEDVIGVINKEQPLEELINSNGQKQVKMLFSITDGRYNLSISTITIKNILS